VNTSLNAYPREFRIRRRPEILSLQRIGKKLYSKHFLIILSPAEQPLNRLAVTVSKKVHKSAVRRNRVKRKIREIFRLHHRQLKGHFDMLIIARKNAHEINYQDTHREILGALRYNGFLREQSPK